MKMGRKLTAVENAALHALSGNPGPIGPGAPKGRNWDRAVRGGFYRPVKAR